MGTTVETIHEVLSSYEPLDALVADRIPSDADPLRDIVFIVRAGALFPIYHTSSLLEQLKGKVVMVTGSTDGLGREVAVRSAALGATVIVHGRNQERGKAVVSEITKAGKGLDTFACVRSWAASDTRG